MSVKEMYFNSQNTIVVKEITSIGKLNNLPEIFLTIYLAIQPKALFTTHPEIS
jgi:hypothetical protein